MRTATRFEALSPSYIREILTTAQQPGMISFAGGLPDPNLFPMSLIREALIALGSDPEAFQYGPTAGDTELRHLILQDYPLLHNPDCLITTGAQQALDLIARSYLNPGDTVLLEVPCYLGALQIFELAQAKIITVAQTPEGPELDQLETLLNRYDPKIFYTVPDFHNPTGVCWSLATREKVARMLNDRNTLLIEDAPYRSLSFKQDELPQVSDLTKAPSIRLGSFSKIATPGLRVGYALGSADLLSPLTLIKQASDLHSTRPAQRILASLLRSGSLKSHVENLRCEYEKKSRFMRNQLSVRINDSAVISDPSGGMFLWLELNNAHARSVTEAALEEGVAVVPGDVFYPQADHSVTTQQALRLNFTQASLDDIDEGIKRLQRGLQAVRNGAFKR